MTGPETPRSPETRVTVNIPGGVESPVFWGSVLGVVTSSLLAGYSYWAGVQTPKPMATESAWIVAVFCCVVGIRYYTSVVFLSYEDFLSNKIRTLGFTERREIFIGQCIMIFGCSLNASLLTSVGALAAGVVILVQASSTILYWRLLWRELVRGPEGDPKMVMILGELAVAILACLIIAKHLGAPIDSQAESALLGSVIIVFLAECTTTYARSVFEFSRRTANYLGLGGQ
jgi:hypothetical protein